MRFSILIFITISSNLLVLISSQGIVPLNPPPTWCNYTERGTFVKLQVSGCATQPCVLYPGKVYEMAPTFVPKFDTSMLHYGALFYPDSGGAIVNLKSVPVPGIHTAETEYRISQEFQIPSSIAGQKGRVRIALLDPHVRDYISRCFDVLIWCKAE